MKNLARKRSVIFLSITLAFLVASIIAVIVYGNILAKTDGRTSFKLFGVNWDYLISLLILIPGIIIGINLIYAIKDIIYRKDNMLLALTLTRGILSFESLVFCITVYVILCLEKHYYYFSEQIGVIYYLAPIIVTLLWIIDALISRSVKQRNEGE